MSKFSKCLKCLREERNVSQSDMATLLGVSPRSYQFYENGEREPNMENLNKLAKYFGVTSDYLFGRSKNRDGSFADHLRMLSTSALFKPIENYYKTIIKRAKKAAKEGLYAVTVSDVIEDILDCAGTKNSLCGALERMHLKVEEIKIGPERFAIGRQVEVKVSWRDS